MKSFVSILVFLGIVVVAAGLFIWSGIYNVAATDPHWPMVYEILEFARDRSVENHAAGLTPPGAGSKEMVQVGTSEFHHMCRHCHGAPGYARETFAMGLYPSPPDLAAGEAISEFSETQIFWIVKNGFKMTGMPSFGLTHEDNELWGIVAFLKMLPKLSPEEYKSMVESSPPDTDENGKPQAGNGGVSG